MKTSKKILLGAALLFVMALVASLFVLKKDLKAIIGKGEKEYNKQDIPPESRPTE